jgi:hypothetical protein
LFTVRVSFPVGRMVRSRPCVGRRALGGLAIEGSTTLAIGAHPARIGGCTPTHRVDTIDAVDEPTLREQGYVKLRMADDDGFTETAWAVRVRDDVDHFRLDNSPFYAYGVSTDDVVEGVRVDDGLYAFVRVIERSGNRTVRMIFGKDRADTDVGAAILAEVRALGCSYEGMFSKVISITVPPAVDLGDVAAYLVSTGLDWEYADPTYDDLFGGAA